jgi:ubiquitin-conjugating enzyme E2 S
MSASNEENVCPQILRQVGKELVDLQKDAPEGVRVFINEEDITDIHAVIDGPESTPYVGGHFRVKLVLGKNFPSEPPKGFFLTKIFHPNVAKNGEICVNTLKKDWRSDYGIKHILLTIKCLLIAPNPESALNEEAGKMLLEHYDDYFSRAKMFTEIHARPPPRSKEESSGQADKGGAGGGGDGPTAAKKHAGDRAVADRKKALADRKKTLKRL